MKLSVAAIGTCVNTGVDVVNHWPGQLGADRGAGTQQELQALGVVLVQPLQII
jgi:hypothetical protein